MINGEHVGLEFDLIEAVIGNVETVEELCAVAVALDRFDILNRNYFSSINDLIGKNKVLLNISKEDFKQFESNQDNYQKTMVRLKTAIQYRDNQFRIAAFPNAGVAPTAQQAMEQMNAMLSQIKTMQENFIKMFGTVPK